ncbi:PAS domain S-box protein [Mucilaginibacter sp. L3T2-6]|uniref:sensor histidine kinase n=1 Tax=Mucilaginibacter sp. L3T2-6 TaxID=3062491 RepID=UPI002675517B|nr:PAS domain S-box protein [Mucilaginibacter sp. L3T2-6]MDO3643783.1 PAS domain S-box protein [Mucilaginibacter sp. L3T2-6]MDV6216234.1 PAS domain S-box protein [Mucilaginibacter sp. L3T2-6]
MINQQDYNPSTPADNPVDFLLFENLPIAIYTCDKSGKITSFNKAAESLWGRIPEAGDKWTASRIFTITGEEVMPENSPLARTVASGVRGNVDEIIVQRPNGDRLYVQSHPVPVFNAAGEVTGGINTLIDVTEKRSSENKQAMLAAIIESSEDAIVSKTLEGIITTWNHSAERMFGYSEAEIVGRSIMTIIPDNRRQEEDLIISKIKKGEKVEHYETYRLTKYNTEIPVSLTISPIKNKNGQVIGASKIARNITKQKDAEESLQRYANNLETLNTVNNMISEHLDVQEILQQVTDVTTQVTGAAFGAFFYNKVDERGESYMLYTLSGAPREAFEKFSMPRNTAIFHPTFSGEATVRSDDITKDPRYGKSAPHYGQPKGHLPVVSYLAVPVISKSGEVIGGLFYGHPQRGKFTVHHEHLIESVAKQAAIALENATLYEEIRKLNSKKDEFIGLASHELKTPVTSLSGYLQIINRRLPEGDANKSFIEKALVQINKLTGLISDLLDVSKIETGQLPLSFTQFDLVQLVNEVTELIQYSASTHVLRLNSTVDNLSVTADRQRIEQVIINLLSNAIKYSPGASAVDISVSADGNKALVSVRDFGPGINKGQQERIFTRFYRVEDMAVHISGLGIGLFISKEIIERHNGRLWVESEVDKGSVFFFEIPLD